MWGDSSNSKHYKWMQQTGPKGVQEWVWVSGERDSLRIIQVTKLWSYKRYMHKPEAVLENNNNNINTTHKIIQYFQIKMAPPILTKTPDLVLINKKITAQQADFVLPVDQRIKIKVMEHEDDSNNNHSWSTCNNK